MEQKESPPTHPKKLKQMKKKLDELNRKIRHSKKRNDGLIHKGNSLRRAIEEARRPEGPCEQRAPQAEIKRGTKPELDSTFTKCDQAFGGAYRSYRVNRRPKMDVHTFFNCIRGELTSLITRELTDLNSARVQATTWIRFIKNDY